MRRRLVELALAALVATTVTAGGTATVRAGDEAVLVLRTLRPSDPCGFYRGQAYGKGMAHFATEMLWACEAIAARRAAGMPLGDRLEAADAAIERYRAAVLAAAMRRFRRSGGGVGATRLGLSEARTLTLADSAGALVALDGIRAGF